MPCVLHLSDLHFGALDRQAADALPGYLGSALRECVLVVVSGDLTQRARPQQFLDARRYLERLTDQLGCPYAVVPGNHDVPLWAVWERLVCPLRRFRRYIGPETFTFTAPGLHVVGINTARRCVPVLRGFWKDGRFDPDDLAASLRRVAPAPNPGTLRLVVAHHPLIRPPGAQTDDGVALGAAAAIDQLRTAGIHLVLGGHLHQPYIARLGDTPDGLGLWSVQAGTATSHRLRPSATTGRPTPCSFNLVTYQCEGEVAVETHAWRTTPGGDEASFARLNRQILGIFRVANQKSVGKISIF